MNKILMKCDGKEFILRTNRKAVDICYVLNMNYKNILLAINSTTLDDEEFKDEIIVKPSKVTLIKDVIEDETINPLDNKGGLDEFAKELIKKINEIQRERSKNIYCV